MKLSGLSTPALVLDRKILNKNIEAMNKIIGSSTLKLRPHYKSHKCAVLAKMQIEHGAIGMTCAKLSEAEDLCDIGVEDILIANQVVDPIKIRKLADLANNCRLTVCVDNIENISALSLAAKNSGSTIHCLVEYDIGMERCGVVDKEDVLVLAKHIANSDNLVFDGLQAYAGHISHIEDINTRKQMTSENFKKLKDLISYLNENGITVKTVSGGSTGTVEIKALEGLYTEIQAGSYLFMDATYRNLSLPFENSLFVLTTVVSQRSGLTVVDAGVKTCGTDQGMPALYSGSTCEIVASEEHFQLHNYTENTAVGEKIRLIPSHCCSTVNLYDKIYLVDGETVVDRILITARGMGK